MHTTEEAALRDNERYLVTTVYNNMIRHTMSFRTLSEATFWAPSKSYIVELAMVQEEAGVPVRKILAMIVDGVWVFSGKQKELDMAKVKANMNGGGRDVENDLLGVSKPRGVKKQQAMAAKIAKPGRPAKAAVAAPTQRGRRSPYEDHQRLKKIGDRNTRPESNVGRVIALLKPNMTFGEFSKAVEKAKLPFKPTGILSFLVKDGVVQVR